MKMPEVSILEWQKRFDTGKACIETLIKVRWPDGFVCPECANRKCSFIITRNSYHAATTIIKQAQLQERFSFD